MIIERYSNASSRRKSELPEVNIRRAKSKGKILGNKHSLNFNSVAANKILGKGVLIYLEDGELSIGIKEFGDKNVRKPTPIGRDGKVYASTLTVAHPDGLPIGKYQLVEFDHSKFTQFKNVDAEWYSLEKI